MWTCFFDMSSGGDEKEKWSVIWIEAPQKEAEIIFYNRFGHNPHRVTCTCCGADYSISEHETLDDTHSDYKNILIITKDDIDPNERTGELPEQGYIWHD